MRKAGVMDYELFARNILDAIRDLPVSFEVLSDEFGEIRQQALRIAGWSENVYVKVPVITTRGELSTGVIRDLSAKGVKVNVTAVLTIEQVCAVQRALVPGTPAS